jgi:MoaA/NifB/PqqE/SkfB family radical SAM enzyme
MVEQQMLPQFKSVLVSVTEACHVGCSHCGFIGSVRDRESEPEEMADWVSQACHYGVPKIIFTGGEPFERLDSLRRGVHAAKACQKPAAVFTSSFWASSPQLTRSTLEQMPGLTHLYLSSDVFHQRRVPYQNVFNVIEVALELKIPQITIYITYANDAERSEVREHYTRYGDRLKISEDRVIPSPYLSSRVLQNQGALRMPHPDEYGCQCEIGTPIINPNGDVFSCHIGKAAAHRDLRHLPYFLGNVREQSFTDIMTIAARRPDYQFLRTYGPRGVAALLAQEPGLSRAVGRDGFTTDCDMCFSTLKTREGRIALERYVSRPEVRDGIDMHLALLLGEDPLVESAHTVHDAARRQEQIQLVQITMQKENTCP